MSSAIKVLLVDDDDMIASLEREVLEDKGFEVDRAENGLEAVGKLEFNEYDLIISDYLMPEMNGQQFYNYLEKKHPELTDKFIIVSGSIFNTNFFTSRGVQVLSKPFSLVEFTETVNNVINKT